MTYIELMEKFPTEESVIEEYIKIRYPHGIYCSRCGGIKVYQEHKRPKLFHCSSCHTNFSPFADTMFEKSSTDLRKWMFAIHLFLNGKKGISGYQLQREIGVTYKTAWRMLKEIRISMGHSISTEFVEAIIEMDECYIGGKPRKGNSHNNDSNDNDDNTKNPTSTENKRGRGTNKTPVIGVLNRTDKKVHAKIALPNKEGKKLTAKQLIEILKAVAKPKDNNTVITDEFKSYNPLARNKYIHLVINHKEMYSDGNGKHTNNIESFWANLKRAVYGIYHHISVKHMQKYIDEFCFRYNNRETDMFTLVLKQSVFA